MSEQATKTRQAPNPDAPPVRVADAPATAPEAATQATPPPQEPKPNGNGTALEVRAPREVRVVTSPIAMFDTAKFEHLGRVANALASGSLLPESLTHWGASDKRQPLPFEAVRANCLLVSNQALNWDMDPIAVAQSVSVVKGKLCFEGKLVAAVLDAKLGVELHHHFIGKLGSDDYRIYLSDRPYTDEVLAKLTVAGVRIPGWRLWDGSVGEWRTSGNGSPWSQAKNHPRMLIYRGTRDWARIYRSSLMLGVYTDDEIEDDRRAERARDVTSREAAQPTEERVRRTAPNPAAPTEVIDGEIIDPVKTEAVAQSEPEQERSMASLYEDSAPADQVVLDVAADDMPAFLNRIERSPETDRLKSALLRDIPALDCVDDFVSWARGAKDTIDRLPTEDQNEVRTAFSARQEVVFKAAARSR